jgi:non-homologous end joining protein Ku
VRVGKNGARAYRLLVKALCQAHRIAVGTVAWRGQTTPIAIRIEEDRLLLQRLYFPDVSVMTEVPMGATTPKVRDEELKAPTRPTESKRPVRRHHAS